MTRLALHPAIAEALVSLAILTGSYLAARCVSYLFGRLLDRAARRTATTLDERLVAVLKRPLTYVLFLGGAYVALHRLPLSARWTGRLDGVLFALAVLLLTLALLRAYGILLAWYAAESPLAAASGLAREFTPLASKLGKVVIALLAAITMLQHFGVNVASLVVSLGVGSLAVGLAAQDTLANMFAGFALMLDRPFKVGDRIQLASGEVGDVVAIGMRATRIHTVDETILVVPNSALVKERVVNQALPTRRLSVRVEVGVAYGSDLAEVRRVLHQAVLTCELVAKEPAPVVVVSRLGDFGVSFVVAFQARDYTEAGLVRSAVNEEIYRRLGEARIEVPVLAGRIIPEPARGAGTA